MFLNYFALGMLIFVFIIIFMELSFSMTFLI